MAGRFTKTNDNSGSSSRLTTGPHGSAPASGGSSPGGSPNPYNWTTEHRKESQSLLQRAGYLPKNYVAKGGIDPTYMNAFSAYLNDREQGAPVLNPDSVSVYERTRAGGGSGGGRSTGGGSRGGGGRAAPAIPTFAEVQDSIVQFYEGLVGTTPTGEVQDWLYQKVAGGQSWQQMEQDIEGQTNYKERYPGIENHPEWTGPDYDKFMQPFDAMSLENLGRVLSAEERSQLLGIKTPEDEEEWLNKMVGASLPSGMDILGDDLGERGNSSG